MWIPSSKECLENIRRHEFNHHVSNLVKTMTELEMPIQDVVHRLYTVSGKLEVPLPLIPSLDLIFSDDYLTGVQEHDGGYSADPNNSTQETTKTVVDACCDPLLDLETYMRETKTKQQPERKEEGESTKQRDESQASTLINEVTP